MFVVLVSLLCILYDLCNCLHCCVNDILSILLYDCVKCPSYEESDIFFETKGGGVRFRLTSWRDFGRLTL